MCIHPHQVYSQFYLNSPNFACYQGKYHLSRLEKVYKYILLKPYV